MSLGRYKDLCIDATDATPLATFWGAALGLDVRRLDDTSFPWHLDLTTPDVGALVSAGATVLAELESWTVLADPEGNEFCAFPEN